VSIGAVVWSVLDSTEAADFADGRLGDNPELLSNKSKQTEA
jgi:hypothetical protein